MSNTQAQVHASAVAVAGKGCLIMGVSGSGKSTLCFQMMALGADLIADDRVDLTASGGRVLLSCPDRLQGRIEARGVGFIQTPHTAEPIPCSVIVDLDTASERLPSEQQRDLLGISCPVIFGAGRVGLASILTVLLGKGGLLDPDRGIGL